MSKPLTIEELKALEVGDWVWLTDSESKGGSYARKDESLYGEEDTEFCFETIEVYDNYLYDDYGKTWLAYKNKEEAEGKDEQIKFTLNGCDIFFTATAPADMTVKQLVKQGSRIKPDWCACGICSADDNDEVEIVFDYNDVKKANDDVSCTIKEEYIK